MGKNLFSNGKQSTTSESWIRMGDRSQLEADLSKGQSQDYRALQQLVRQNEGGTEGGNRLAELLNQFSQGGFMPGQDDFNTANQFTDNAFATQQTGLNQQFDDMETEARRMAAQLGRPINDPIVRNKLMQEKARQQQTLNAQKRQYSSDFALNLPKQKLGYTAQFADVQNALASQAMSNRQALLSLGSQLQSGERNWRLNTGTQVNQNTQKGPSMGFLQGASQVMGFGGQVAAAINGIPTGTAASPGTMGTSTNYGGDTGSGMNSDYSAQLAAVSKNA